METYTLVALPEDSLLPSLNDVRNHLYIKGFRHASKPNTSDVHISLAQTKLQENQPEPLRELVQDRLATVESFSAALSRITSEVRPLSEKYPEGNG